MSTCITFIRAHHHQAHRPAEVLAGLEIEVEQPQLPFMRAQPSHAKDREWRTWNAADGRLGGHSGTAGDADQLAMLRPICLSDSPPLELAERHGAFHLAADEGIRPAQRCAPAIEIMERRCEHGGSIPGSSRKQGQVRPDPAITDEMEHVRLVCVQDMADFAWREVGYRAGVAGKQRCGPVWRAGEAEYLQAAPLHLVRGKSFNVAGREGIARGEHRAPFNTGFCSKRPREALDRSLDPTEVGRLVIGCDKEHAHGPTPPLCRG